MDWPGFTFDQLSDFVAVLGPSGDLLYANPRAHELLGLEPGGFLGRNMADFIHPDELERAVRVVSRIADDAMGVQVTPALYRLRHAHGGWVTVEINGTVMPAEGGADGDGSVVIVGRYSGDRNLFDEIMQALTRGDAIDDVVALVPGFGTWRHPDDHYAVLYRADDGRPAVVGSTLIAEVVAAAGAGDEPSPPSWLVGVDPQQSVVVMSEALPDPIRARAAALGLRDVWAEPVPDPLHDETAVMVGWSRPDGPDVAVHEYPVEMMARAMRLILQWRQQVAGLRRAARRDPLTGLANRTGFWEVLEALGDDRRRPRVGVLYVDLDGFKGVNDAHGHAFGDIVLAEAATRINGVLRPGDTVARLGGDEFAIVCHHLTSDDDAMVIAERVVERLAEPFHADGRQVRIGASVGIATVEADRLDADELLDAADRALYRAKRDGRGRWHLASASL